jgi:hypothetical protein
LAKPPVIIVNQEFRLFLEADVPDLLFGPLERWMIGYMQGYDLSTGKLHDDEYIKDLKGDRVLHKKVTGPDGLGLVLQKASPGLGICWSRTPFDYVSSYGRAGMSKAKLDLQLQGDTIFTILRMIGRYPLDEANVINRYWASARFPL